MACSSDIRIGAPGDHPERDRFPPVGLNHPGAIALLTVGVELLLAARAGNAHATRSRVSCDGIRCRTAPSSRTMQA